MAGPRSLPFGPAPEEHVGEAGSSRSPVQELSGVFVSSAAVSGSPRLLTSKNNSCIQTQYLN